MFTFVNLISFRIDELSLHYCTCTCLQYVHKSNTRSVSCCILFQYCVSSQKLFNAFISTTLKKLSLLFTFVNLISFRIDELSLQYCTCTFLQYVHKSNTGSVSCCIFFQYCVKIMNICNISNRFPEV